MQFISDFMLISHSYNCGNEGHMSRDCPEGPKDNKACYRCGQPGHISRDCPSGGAPDGGHQGGRGGSSECYKVRRMLIKPPQVPNCLHFVSPSAERSVTSPATAPRLVNKEASAAATVVATVAAKVARVVRVARVARAVLATPAVATATCLVSLAPLSISVSNQS